MPEKLLTLGEWADEVYGKHPPAIKTLYRWVSESRIYPPPEKQGRSYYVLSSARYIDPSKPVPMMPRSEKARPLSLVERIRQDEVGRKRR